ncbi:MAG: glycosyltransferase family 4 protein [bacterium]
MKKSIKKELNREYEKYMREKNIDVILAEYGPTGVEMLDVAVRMKIPVVVHFHGFDASVYKFLKKYKNDYQRLFAEAAAIIAVSEKMRKRIVEMGADENNVFLIPCGVDVDKFVSHNRNKKDGKNLLFVGRFVEKKGPDHLIKVFSLTKKKFPDIKLNMIGDGKMIKKCKIMCRDLNLMDSVSFLGRRDHDFVAEMMAKSDIYVQHSIKAESGDEEGTPVSVMEAMASGLPVVSTFHGGIPDVVKHKDNGYLVAEKDFVQMSKYLNELLSDKLLLKKMGERSRKLALENLSVKKRIADIDKVLNKALDENI